MKDESFFICAVCQLRTPELDRCVAVCGTEITHNLCPSCSRKKTEDHDRAPIRPSTFVKLNPAKGDILVMTYPAPACREDDDMVHRSMTALSEVLPEGVGFVAAPEGFNVETLVDHLRGRGYTVEKREPGNLYTCPRCKKTRTFTTHTINFCDECVAESITEHTPKNGE